MNSENNPEPVEAEAPIVVEQPASTAISGAKTLEERKELLSRQLAQRIAATGGRLESQTDTMAVLVRGKRVNHILHFLLGFPTIGFWWLTVWPALVIFGGEKRQVVTVDDYGNILTQKA